MYINEMIGFDICISVVVLICIFNISNKYLAGYITDQYTIRVSFVISYKDIFFYAFIVFILVLVLYN